MLRTKRRPVTICGMFAELARSLPMLIQTAIDEESCGAVFAAIKDWELE